MSAPADNQARLLGWLQRTTLLPVLTPEEVEATVAVVERLAATGLATIEITLRGPAARAAAAAAIKAVPGALIGVGTVRSIEDLALATGIGAAFAVSPGMAPALLEDAQRRGIPFLPGVATASEVMAAMAAGCKLMKLFPAEPLGGIATLRSLAGPFPETRFCATGGIRAEQLGAYLAEPNVAAVGGSWFAPADEMHAGALDRIAERARDALALARSLRRAT